MVSEIFHSDKYIRFISVSPTLLFFLDSDYDNSNLSKQRRNNTDSHKFAKAKDDGSITCYKARLEQYYTRLEQEKKMLDIRDEEDEGDHVINGQLKIPCSIWNNLYR